MRPRTAVTIASIAAAAVVVVVAAAAAAAVVAAVGASISVAATSVLGA
jgi:hypothetical protein